MKILKVVNVNIQQFERAKWLVCVRCVHMVDAFKFSNNAECSTSRRESCWIKCVLSLRFNP